MHFRLLWFLWLNPHAIVCFALRPTSTKSRLKDPADLRIQLALAFHLVKNILIFLLLGESITTGNSFYFYFFCRGLKQMEVTGFASCLCFVFAGICMLDFAGFEVLFSFGGPQTRRFARIHG